jgi:membrane carboxypeptidase/penicillin-binding protein
MILRNRRNLKSKDRALPVIGKALVGTIAIFILIILSAAFLAGLYYASLLHDLPSVGNVETMFSRAEDGFLDPIQVFDRTGERKLFDLLNPQAAERKWVEVEEDDSRTVLSRFLQAIVIVEDDTFWTNKGYDPKHLIAYVLQAIFDKSVSNAPRSITQQLVGMTLLPSEDLFDSPLKRYLREAILAQRLTDRYAKEQILEWYINTVGYGNLAYGLDAAALVYFGKHADELSLAEMTLVATFPQESDLNPLDSLESVSEKQRDLLQILVDKGMVTEMEARSASSEALTFTQPDYSHPFEIQQYTWKRLAKMFGEAVVNRGNLRVITTLDDDLQLQMACAAAVHMSRLSGKEPESGMPTTEDEGCIASAKLPTLRPGEVGKYRDVEELAGMIIDPRSGEILSLYGDVEKPIRSETMLYPFIYLAAFARGNSPGTMVLDLPLDTSQEHAVSSPAGYLMHGPVRMRIALAGGYPLAARQAIQLSGMEMVQKVMRQMGIFASPLEQEGAFNQDLPEYSEISLEDLIYAYGIFANEGTLVGVEIERDEAQGEWRSLDPIFIREVEGDFGEILYQADRTEQSILSASLAYLVTHVLGDDSARWPTFGSPNILELNSTTAVLNGSMPYSEMSWAVGYTPSRVVGFWLGNPSGEQLDFTNALTGSAPLWHALMEYVSQESPLERWEQPSEIVTIDVCDPSGLLPTTYCSKVVKEVFLDGTEPVYFDTFYQPVRINKETGKLATLLTPLDDVEEHVYFIPPPEAASWAREAGFPQPPEEYDTVQYDLGGESTVSIDSPSNFEYIRGKIWIRGRADVDDFDYYRLQYGGGLNPTHWYQIDEEHLKPVQDGVLALWDTRGLDGLYTLQLEVINQDERLVSSTRFLTVDNQAPEIEILTPNEGMEVKEVEIHAASFEVRVQDNIEVLKVEFFVDERKMATLFSAPYAVQIPIQSPGERVLFVKAYDAAGNVSESEHVILMVIR